MNRSGFKKQQAKDKKQIRNVHTDIWQAKPHTVLLVKMKEKKLLRIQPTGGESSQFSRIEATYGIPPDSTTCGEAIW